MEKLYLYYCDVCKKKTVQLTHLVSRMRGIKLRCSGCGKIKTRYYKANKLKEVE